MKKSICKFLLVAVIFAGLCLPAAACYKESQATLETTIKIADFESADELFKFDYLNRFGAVSLNTDDGFIKSGSASVKLEIHGDYNKGTDSTLMKVSFKDLGLGEKFDFSKIKNVQFDCFNMSGKAQKLGAALIVDGVETQYTYISVSTDYSKAIFAFNPVSLAIGSDLTKGEGIMFSFPKIALYGDPAIIFYMDNLTVENHVKAPEPLQLILDENELCSFDKFYQQYLITYGGVGPTVGSRPIATINKDLQYCKGMKGYSLKVELPTSLPPFDDGWPYFGFINKLWESIDLTSHVNDGNELVFDVYNTGSPFNFCFTITSKNTLQSREYARWFTLKNGWNEIRLPMSEWNHIEDIEDEKRIALTENYKDIYFLYNKFATDKKEFYFDNFRFE